MIREDCATLTGWLTDPYLLLMTAPDWRHPLTAGDVERAYFGPSGSVEPLTAVADGGMVGHLGFHRPRSDAGHLIHVIVDPALKGQGYGTAILNAIIRRSFEREDVRRLSLHVYSENVSAIACYLRAGFQIEGRHREVTLWNDRTFDTYSMALLRHEWEQLEDTTL
jgi:RimJ/RimL family protein N-acetyltransferase